MHFHARKAIRLHRMTVYSILFGFFILGFSPGISFADDGQQVDCWWTDSDGVNHNSCGGGSSTTGGSSSSGGAAAGAALRKWIESIFFPPPDPYADKRKKRMNAAWTRGANFHNQGHYFSARDEYNFALKNCDKRKDCNKLRKIITKTYRDDHADQALDYFYKENYKQAKNRFQLAFQYCRNIKDSKCKKIEKNIHLMDAIIIRLRGIDLEKRKHWALALQEFKKAQNICRQYRLSCDQLKTDLTRIKMGRTNDEGNNLYQEGHFTEAIKKYQVALSHCNNKANCKSIKNNLLRAEGKIAALKMNGPNDAGIAFSKNGQYDQALKSFKLAKQYCKSPKSCEIIEGNIQRVKQKNKAAKMQEPYDRAQLLFENGQHKEAIKEYKIALKNCTSEKSCQNIETLIKGTKVLQPLRKADHYGENRDYKNAERYYEKALKVCFGELCEIVKNRLTVNKTMAEVDPDGTMSDAFNLHLENEEYQQAGEILDRMQADCQSVEVCKYLDETISDYKLNVAITIGDRMFEEGNYSKALENYRLAYNECISTKCSEKMMKLIKNTETERQGTNQPAESSTLTSLGQDSGDYISPSFEEIILNEFNNMEGRLADIDGICAYWAPQDCGDVSNALNKNFEAIDSWLTDAISGKLPEQQRLDEDLKNGTITSEEWQDGSAAADRNSLETLGKLGAILEADAAVVRDQWAGLQGQVDAGQITPEQGNELAAGYGAALGNIEDKQDGVDAATDATLGRINLLPPVYDDEEE